MKLHDYYWGSDDPFEGDRMLWLRSLPAEAQVTKATITLTPEVPTDGKLFKETFVFTTDVGSGELPADDWGITKVPEQPGLFVEVDFHARRTLAAVMGSQGSNIGNVPGTETHGASLQVDMGGSYVGIANDGTFMAPDKTPWVVTLSSVVTPLPGLTVNKFRLSAVPQDPTNPVNATLDVREVTIRPIPTNVSVRLGQMAPFWTRLGELAIGETSPGFADVLNAFLAEAQIENGFYAIPFVVHSDTIARLDVTLNIDYVIEQPVLPPHLPEVTIPYNFSTVPGVDEALTTVSLPREAIPVSGRTGAQVRGEFESTRVASGPIGEEPTTFPVLVSPKCALAQPLESGIEIAVTGIDLPLANTQPGLAGLHVAIQSDADGKPSGEILTSADVRVEKPLPDQSAWGSATLPSEFRVLPGVRYWLVLQSQVGQAYWNATSGTANEPALQCSRDGGLSWRMATAPGAPAPLAALFRLRDTPDRFTVPVQLQIGKGAHAVRRRLDEFAPLGRFEFSFDFAEKLEEYLAGPSVASPCGTGELLTNGNFDQPPHDDATRRLFGFSSKKDEGSLPQPATFVGTIDLSDGIELSYSSKIKLGIDDGDAKEIVLCEDQAATQKTLVEIVKIINGALALNVASHDGKNLILTSPSTGSASQIRFLVPKHSTDDVTERIFGIIPPKVYEGTVKAQIVGIVDLSQGVDLSMERFITLSIDGYSPKLIDCAGAIPAQTKPDEVVTAINNAMDMIVAAYDQTENALKITSPTVGTYSTVQLYTWCRPQVPDNWQGIPGRIVHYRGPETGRRFAVLVAARFVSGKEQMTHFCFLADPNALHALTGEPAELSQRIPVKANCLYLLRTRCQFRRISQFQYMDLKVEETSALPLPPRWHIEWLDANGAPLGTDDETIEITAQSQLVEALVTAPEGAVEADLSFVLPSSSKYVYVLILEEVSFAPTSVALHNGSFGQWTDGANGPLPVGWTRLSGLLQPGVDKKTQQMAGVKLRGDGPEDAVLTQTVEVVAGESYELRVCARPEFPSADDTANRLLQHRARLELRWLDNGLLDEPVILPLDGLDFPSHAWAGVAPVGATRAEVRLVQPRSQGNLLVESVSLERADLVSVPLIFLGEAPGELTVSDLRVTYDLPAPPASSKEPREAAVQMPVVKPKQRISALATEPAAIVAGVGKRFSVILNRLATPVGTIGKLAALDPAVKILGIPRERRLELKAAAEMVLDSTVECAAPFSALADQPLETLMTLSAAELTRTASQPRDRADRLQQKLRALRLLLNNKAFCQMRLSDLLPAARSKLEPSMTNYTFP